MSDAPLVQCKTCRCQTLPGIAQAQWPRGVCELCRDPQEGAAVRETLRRAKAHFAKERRQ